MSDDTIIVTSDSGYEAIYIGSIFSDSRKPICAYIRTTLLKEIVILPQRKLRCLLTLVVKGEKLPEGEGKAAYFDYGDMKKQLKCFSKLCVKWQALEP